MNLKNTPFLEIPTIQVDIHKEERPDGVIYLKSKVELQEHPERVTERLIHWVEQSPQRVFLGQRDKSGKWLTQTYQKTWEKAQTLAQFLLTMDVSEDRPIAILSGNSIEHGLLALAAMHIGVPYSPISPAYATKSRDYAKLRHCIRMLSPGLVFVQNAKAFEKPIQAVANHIPVLAVEDLLPGNIAFEEALKTQVTVEVENGFNKISAATIAKILFTSGSTGLPKGVINTHGNLTTNWQQITQTFPFMANGGINLIDWLPWNHTFGGNHNFGLTLYNGGSLYIDGGNPTPSGIKTTVQNLRDIAPTIYFNVPKGFEELIPHLMADKNLCQFFFSQLKMFFYAGASMPQHVWDGLEELAYKTTGKRLLIATGLGMTEASPSAMFNTEFGSFAGMLGVPVPGLEVKLVPDGDKMEARFRGQNLTPGYWRNPEATAQAFDEEGYYKTGDALKMVDQDKPNRGMIFDGRIAEDFKLDTGTWVSVGVLRAKLIATGDGLIQDAVITGHDRPFLGAIIIPEENYCRALSGLSTEADLEEIVSAPKVVEALQEVLNKMGKRSTGSSNRIRRATFANFKLSIDKGEITDKGSINQRAILKHRADWVARIYQKELPPQVLEYQNEKHDTKEQTTT